MSGEVEALADTATGGLIGYAIDGEDADAVLGRPRDASTAAPF